MGEPDFIQTLNQNLRLVIENLSEHQEETTSPISVYNQVRQIFGYLSHNHLQYGALTTYDKTWFLFRPPDNPGQFYISPAIQCDDQQPTLFQCLLYLTSLARTNHECNPAPPSPKQPQSHDSDPSPGNNADDSSYPENDDKGDSPHDDDEPKQKSGSAKTGGRTPKRGQGHKTPIAGGRSRVKTRPSHGPLNRDEKQLPLDFFDWDSFRVLDVLGYGRSGTVFKAVLHGEIVALKICDLWQHPDYKEELLNEVKVDCALEDLQGNSIPRLKGAGYTAGGLFAVATNIVGRPLEDRESLSDKERSIHHHGFVHGDIREENILTKHDGGEFYACFIDFAFSKEGDRSGFRKEKKTLVRLLGQS